MANSKIIFYPVGNGDMTLIKLNDSNETTILIDMHVRNTSHDEKHEDYDAMTHLKKHLKKDVKGRYVLDAFILTHADQDHIGGLQSNFYLGDPSDYKDKDKEDEKIIINEMWSSCRFWKRTSEEFSQSPDAKAFNKEMKRRVNLYSDTKRIQGEGNRARIIGSDHKNTDGIKSIVYELETTVNKINERLLPNYKMLLLGPLETQETESEDDIKNDKNRFSVILQITITQNGHENKILMTGDAEVGVWEFNDQRYADRHLEYDILHLPHHCSMSCLGRKENGDDKYTLSNEARNALSHARDKNTAFIISSSKEILNDKNNPPHYDAKQEYLKFINDKNNFLCTQEHKVDGEIVPIEIELTSGGTQKTAGTSGSKFTTAAATSSSQAYEHG